MHEIFQTYWTPSVIAVELDCLLRRSRRWKVVDQVCSYILPAQLLHGGAISILSLGDGVEGVSDLVYLVNLPLLC